MKRLKGRAKLTHQTKRNNKKKIEHKNTVAIQRETTYTAKSIREKE